MIEIIELVVTPFSQNCRILSAGGEAVVIDPGGDAPLILEELKKRGLILREIWLTHSHLDHCGGVSRILKAHQVPLIAHPIEATMRDHVVEVASMYGAPPGMFENCPQPDVEITGGEKLKFQDAEFEALFTPGHSPGHISFYNPSGGYVIAGDVLFAGSIGRTDLPGGDHNLLLKSVREKLFVLPPETSVLSGHGPNTTIGTEMRDNPFFNGLY